MDIIVVGCGGVAFHAASWVTSLLEMNPGSTLLAIDPDVVEAKNRRRQWNQVGRAKAELFVETVLPKNDTCEGIAIVDKVESADALAALEAMAAEETASGQWNGLMLLWPDNMTARRAAVSDLHAVICRAGINSACAIVAAGCDPQNASAYGAFFTSVELVDRGIPLAEIDWPWSPPLSGEEGSDAATHGEEGDDSGAEVTLARCDGQSVMANMAASLLSLQLVSYMQTEYVTGTPIGERGGPCKFFWDGTRCKAWQSF